MGFVRIKKIKNKEYAYLVENVWTSKGSRQKVRKYLGKCFRPERTRELAPPNISQLNYKQSINALLKWQLLEHGFQQGLPGLMIKGQIVVDLNNHNFFFRERPCVIAMNEGYASTETIHQAIDFRPAKKTQEEIGTELAQTLLEAGLKIPQETFVQVFEKVTKPQELMNKDFENAF